MLLRCVEHDAVCHLIFPTGASLFLSLCVVTALNLARIALSTNRNFSLLVHCQGSDRRTLSQPAFFSLSLRSTALSLVKFIALKMIPPTSGPCAHALLKHYEHILKINVWIQNKCSFYRALGTSTNNSLFIFLLEIKLSHTLHKLVLRLYVINMAPLQYKCNEKIDDESSWKKGLISAFFLLKEEETY